MIVVCLPLISGPIRDQIQELCDSRPYTYLVSTSDRVLELVQRHASSSVRTIVVSSNLFQDDETASMLAIHTGMIDGRRWFFSTPNPVDGMGAVVVEGVIPHQDIDFVDRLREFIAADPETVKDTTVLKHYLPWLELTV